MAYGVKYYRGTLPASILSEVFEKIAREMEHSSTLPELVNEHPHAMFDLLLSIWQPDGRNGESITQTQIANEISEKIGREFNKNAYILKFIGKVIARKFYRQLIKPDEARAFLEIVFREWTGGPKSYSPPINIEMLIENISKAIFGHDWTGHRTDISQLIQKLAALNVSPITIQDIEHLIKCKLHLKADLSAKELGDSLSSRDSNS